MGAASAYGFIFNERYRVLRKRLSMCMHRSIKYRCLSPCSSNDKYSVCEVAL